MRASRATGRATAKARRSGEVGSAKAARRDPVALPLRHQSLRTAPVTQTATAVSRLPLVQKVLNRPSWQSMNAAVTEVRESLRAETGEEIAHSTLRDWVAAYKRYGADGLVRQHRSDLGIRHALAAMPKRRGLSEEAVNKMMRDSLCKSKGSASVLWKDLQKRWPHARFARKTVYRWAQAWKRENAHLFLMASEGEGRFHDGAAFYLGWGPVAPLSLSALDSTQLDRRVRFYDPEEHTQYRVIRPWVTLMMDVGSRAGITFEVTIKRPTAGTVLSLLRRAWCEGENWAGLPNVPVPQHFRVDAGGEHKGVFQKALKTYGLDKRVVAGRPERQPHIERAIQTVFGQHAVRGQFGHTEVDRVAGPTDTSTREHARGKQSAQREPRRTERDPVDLITLDELMLQLRDVVIAYNATKHGGLVQQARDVDAARRAA